MLNVAINDADRRRRRVWIISPTDTHWEALWSTKERSGCSFLLATLGLVSLFPISGPRNPTAFAVLLFP